MFGDWVHANKKGRYCCGNWLPHFTSHIAHRFLRVLARAGAWAWKLNSWNQKKSIANQEIRGVFELIHKLPSWWITRQWWRRKKTQIYLERQSTSKVCLSLYLYHLLNQVFIWFIPTADLWCNINEKSGLGLALKPALYKPNESTIAPALPTKMPWVEKSEASLEAKACKDLVWGFDLRW